MSAPKRSRTPEPAPRGAGNQSAQSGSLQAQFIAMVENFDDRSQEWRRLFSEVLGELRRLKNIRGPAT